MEDEKEAFKKKFRKDRGLDDDENGEKSQLATVIEGVGSVLNLFGISTPKKKGNGSYSGFKPRNENGDPEEEKVYDLVDERKRAIDRNKFKKLAVTTKNQEKYGELAEEDGENE